ncbi:FHA domain-containing protein [Parafrigoribacterium soli]|uniref:FHA domain-containing protein n=1 Tax=Parafrigoribacterium soli TaxID=3144663 RepID=UPI0032EB5CE4
MAGAKVDDEDSPMIAPPPGLSLPPQPRPSPDRQDAAAVDPEEFITLPPGVIDSGTYRVANPRVVPQRSASDDIVFFTAGAGVPPTPGVVPPPRDAASDAGVELPEAPHRPELQWRLVLPGGIGARAVERALFIGRNPARTDERPDAELLPLVDPAKSLSKTHALVEVEAGQLWVHDLDSTNGVFIVPDDSDAIEVAPGTRAAVPAGATLELGDYVIRVECD